MNVSFDASDLSAYITKVGQQSDAVIARGRALPAAIRSQTAQVVPVDPQVVGVANEAKESLNAQADTLGSMFEALGGRVGTVGTEIKSFMDRSIEQTGAGVSKLGADVFKVNTPEALSSTTRGLGTIDQSPGGNGNSEPTPPGDDGPPTL